MSKNKLKGYEHNTWGDESKTLVELYNMGYEYTTRILMAGIRPGIIDLFDSVCKISDLEEVAGQLNKLYIREYNISNTNSIVDIHLMLRNRMELGLRHLVDVINDALLFGTSYKYICDVISSDKRVTSMVSILVYMRDNREYDYIEKLLSVDDNMVILYTELAKYTDIRNITSDRIDNIRCALQLYDKGLDGAKLLNASYDEGQLMQISRAICNDIDIDIMLNPEFSKEKMREIRKILKLKDNDLMEYVDIDNMTATELQESRIHHKNRAKMSGYQRFRDTVIRDIVSISQQAINMTREPDKSLTLNRAKRLTHDEVIELLRDNSIEISISMKSADGKIDITKNIEL